MHSPLLMYPLSGCAGGCEDQCVGPFQEDSACCIAHRYDPNRNGDYCISEYRTSLQQDAGNNVVDALLVRLA